MFNNIQCILEQKNKYMRYMLLPIITSFSFLIYHMTQNIAVLLVGIIALFLPLLFFNVDHVFNILFFFLANESMFKKVEGGQTYISFFILFLFLKILIMSRFKSRKTYVFWVIILLMSMLVKGGIHSQLIDMSIIRIIAILGIFTHVLHIDGNMRYEPMEHAKWYVMGSFVASLCGLISFIYKNPISRIPYFRLVNIGNDPNFFGVSLALAISFSLLVYGKEKKKKYLYLIMFFILMGILTQSRGFIAANIPNIILLFWLFPKMKLKEIIYIGTILLIGLLLILGGENLGQALASFAHRFDDLNNIDSGRFEIWSNYIKLVMSNPKYILFGIGGIGNDVLKSYAMPQAPHNLFIGAIVDKGLIISLQLLVIALFLVGYFKKRLNVKRLKLIYFTPFISVFLGYFFLDAITQNLLYFSFYSSILLSARFSK